MNVRDVFVPGESHKLIPSPLVTLAFSFLVRCVQLKRFGYITTIQ